MTTIVREVNALYGSYLNNKTISRYVRAGLVGVSPLKQGPVGDFPKPIYDALKGAYSTYLKLEQAESIKQSHTGKLTKKVNKCVNKAGFQKTRDDLARKLKRDTAHEFEAGKGNVQESRRVMWTVDN